MTSPFTKAAALFQRLGELSLLADGGADGLFALGDVAQLIVLFLDLLNLHFIQSAGGFLAVAADERDGGTFGQQAQGAADLSFRQAESAGYK